MKKRLREKNLLPLFETRISRTAALIKIKGEGVVELAIDIGEVRAGEKAEPIFEVELELKSGAPFAILTVAERPFRRRGGYAQQAA